MPKLSNGSLSGFADPLLQLLWPLKAKVLGNADYHIACMCDPAHARNFDAVDLLQALKGLKSLVVNALFNATNTKGQNPLWEGIKYDGPDPERPVVPSKERTDAEAVLQRAILDLTNPPCR